jgi:hypothetical protein
MKISPTCTKTFEFTAGAQVHIPTSAWRPTSVTVLSQRESEAVPMQHFLIDVNSKTTTAAAETILLEHSNSGNIVYVALRTEENTTVGWKFPCVIYQRDVETRQEDYDMQSFSRDLTHLEHRPVVLPHGKISLVSSAEAQNHIAKLEHHRQQLLAALYDCRRSTAIAELGATEANAEETMKHIDWKRSYCVPSDTHLSEVMIHARDMHHLLATTSNMAVDNQWLDPPRDWNTHRLVVSEAVSDLLRTRKELCARVAGRRMDLESVVRVRTSFLLISAIDDALRSVCGPTQLNSTSLFAAENISCHAYWLGQMKSNTNNSVVMDDKCYSEACTVLDLCQRVKNCGIVLMPECHTKLSNLTRSVWQNMHLQGLPNGHDLVVASVPHFLYKQKQVIDFSHHSLLRILKKVQLPTEEQIQSTKLLAILVSADVEHRIIMPCINSMIEQKWELACQKSADALDSLCDLFDPSIRSLITSAVGSETGADISFVTDAHSRLPVTGYNNELLSKINSAHLEDTLLSQIECLTLSLAEL